jgi:hypothetical protein
VDIADFDLKADKLSWLEHMNAVLKLQTFSLNFKSIMKPHLKRWLSFA